MKRIILALLLISIATPTIAQTLGKYKLVGYIEAKKTCDLINRGVTDHQQINYMIQQTLSSDNQYLLDVVAYHLEHYGKDELVNAYFDGFINGIKPCQDDYDRLFLNQ